MPLVRFVELQSVISIAVGTYWVSPSRHGVRRLRGIPSRAVPRPLAIAGYSSLALFVLFRVPSCLSCRRFGNDGRLP